MAVHARHPSLSCCTQHGGSSFDYPMRRLKSGLTPLFAPKKNQLSGAALKAATLVKRSAATGRPDVFLPGGRAQPPCSTKSKKVRAQSRAPLCSANVGCNCRNLRRDSITAESLRCSAVDAQSIGLQE
jgi:hypothetical protein